MQDLKDKFFIDKGKLRIDNIGLNTQPYLLEELYPQVGLRDVIFITKDRIHAQKTLDAVKFLTGRKILFFPEWDTAPYENISPTQNLLHQRMRTLFQIISSPGQKIIITSIRAVLQRIPTKTILESKIFSLRVDEIIKRGELIKYLMNLGYMRVSYVTTAGEFSIRGEIVDISAGVIGYGCRIDFFGDQIESIKVFDIASQITSESRTSINIFPPSELIISDDTIANFESYLLNTVGPNYKENQMLSNIRDQIKPLGIENFLPAFYSNLGDIFEYLTKPVVILDNFIKLEAEKFLDKVQAIYKSKIDENPKTKLELLSPDNVWLSRKELVDKFKHHCLVEFYPFKNYISETEVNEVSSICIRSEIETVPAFYQKSSIRKVLLSSC